jgi:hypothetical protein
MESFRAVRWIRTINLILQAVLFLTLFGGLNYVARNHAWRFDLTRHRTFSLSPETLAYIKSLPRPVQIVVTAAEEYDSPEIRGLLDEFVHATHGNPSGQVKVQYLDVYQDRRRAEELGIEQPNLIVLRSGDKRRAVPVTDLYRYKDKQREAFNGEQVLASALLDVSHPSRKRIYFLVGHGEMRPDNPDPAVGLSVLRDQLRIRNFEIDTLELAVARRIPADASLLISVAPTTGYTRAEQEMLRQYLSVNAGRLILLLGPGAPVSRLGLEDLLLDDWGVLVDDTVVVDDDPAFITPEGDLMIRAFDADHAITQALVSHHMPLQVGATRTVRPDPGRTTGTGLTVVPLAATSGTAWGEVDYRRQMPARRDAADIRPIAGMPPLGKLSISVASERVSVRDNLPFSVPAGRLVVFGAGDLVSNQRIGYFGNFPIFLGAVNWAVDRDEQLNVPPRPIERFQLAMSSGEFTKLRYALLLGLPGATLLLGVLVYWTRRS